MTYTSAFVVIQKDIIENRIDSVSVFIEVYLTIESAKQAIEEVNVQLIEDELSSGPVEWTSDFDAKANCSFCDWTEWQIEPVKMAKRR